MKHFCMAMFALLFGICTVPIGYSIYHLVQGILTLVLDVLPAWVVIVTMVSVIAWFIFFEMTDG